MWNIYCIYMENKWISNVHSDDEKENWKNKPRYPQQQGWYENVTATNERNVPNSSASGSISWIMERLSPPTLTICCSKCSTKQVSLGTNSWVCLKLGTPTCVGLSSCLPVEIHFGMCRYMKMYIYIYIYTYIQTYIIYIHISYCYLYIAHPIWIDLRQTHILQPICVARPLLFAVTRRMSAVGSRKWSLAVRIQEWNRPTARAGENLQSMACSKF